MHTGLSPRLHFYQNAKRTRLVPVHGCRGGLGARVVLCLGGKRQGVPVGRGSDKPENDDFVCCLSARWSIWRENW